jgi:hypothetical protein
MGRSDKLFVQAFESESLALYHVSEHPARRTHRIHLPAAQVLHAAGGRAGLFHLRACSNYLHIQFVVRQN